MTSIANGDKRRRASTGANRMASLRMVTLLTTKNDLVVKTAAIRKIAKRKLPTNAAPGHPRLPRGCPSPPRALQHAQRCPSEKKRCRIEQPSLQMTAFLTTNEPTLVKTAPICKKNSFRSAGGGPTAVPPARRLCRPGQPGPTNSLARIGQSDSPDQTARQPSIRIERFASSARTARQLKSTSS